MRRTLRLALVMCAAAAPAMAQSDAGGWTPTLELRVISATPEGSRAGASNSWALATGGEPIVSTVWTGATLCVVGIGGAELPSYANADGSVWKLNGEYLGSSAGRHQIRLTSRFERLAGQNPPTPTTQTLKFREGDSAILDVLSAPVEDRCSTHTVVMEARLLMRPANPALTRTHYAAELWMLHTEPGGQQRREKLLLNVDGSAAVPFMFNPLRFALPPLDPRQGDIAGVIELAGSLRARTRADGQVDVDIDTRPFIFTLENPALSSFLMDPKRKTLTVKPEETTAIDFPPPRSGMTSVALDTAIGAGRAGIGVGRVRIRPDGTVEGANPPATAIEVRQNRLVMNTAEFYKGHRLQLLITLRRLP